MPIFTYKCEQCRKKQDILVLPGEKEPVTCTYCGGTIKKVPSSGVGLVFKGSGFYITDYTNKGKKDSGSKD
jgi:putative FmdB family regulatory protein